MKTLTSFQTITAMAQLFNFKRMSFLVSNMILDYSHHRYLNCVFSHLPVYSKRLCTVQFDHDNNINDKAYNIPNSLWEIIADLGKPQEIAATAAVISSSSESENYPNSSHAHLNQPSNNPETECETTAETQIIFSPPKSVNEPSARIPIDFNVIQKPFIPSFRSPVDQPHHCKSLYEEEKEDEQQHMRIIETRTKLAKAFIGERIEVLNMIQQLTGAKIVYTKGEAVNGKAMTKVVVTGMVVGVEKATRLLLELVQN